MAYFTTIKFADKFLHETRYIIWRNRYYTTKALSLHDLRKCYAVLEIAENSDQEQIRAAYLKLVKKFHPDSGTKEACSVKFKEIDAAFRILLNVKAKERWDVQEEVDFDKIMKEFDIKHTAPQHRQYLNYDGMGYGTPFQREKQYSKIKAMVAAENVLNHRIQKTMTSEKTLIDKNLQEQFKSNSRQGIERLVEDLIQEAMTRGEFDNLKGTGKPLKENVYDNPYVDTVQHKLNRILIDNGFTPEWIMLQKEIREDKERVENELNKKREELGIYPFDDIDQYKWRKIMQAIDEDVKLINKKVDKFNLVVPMIQKQMLHFKIEQIAEKVKKDGHTKLDLKPGEDPELVEQERNPENLFSFLEAILFKRV